MQKSKILFLFYLYILDLFLWNHLSLKKAKAQNIMSSL